MSIADHNDALAMARADEHKKEIERFRVREEKLMTYIGLLILSTDEAYAFAIKNGFDTRGKFAGHLELGIALREEFSPDIGGWCDKCKELAQNALDAMKEASDD